MPLDSPTGQNLYTIVIAGQMNPSIHHPTWYSANNLITDSENEQALSDLVCLPPVSQFSTDSIAVKCEQTRWKIQTVGEGNTPRIVRIASEVFNRLDETPVGAFGLNIDSHRLMQGVDVASRLADLVSSLALGLPALQDQATNSAKIQWTSSAGLTALNMRIEPSPRDKEAVFVGLNYHHRIDPNSSGQQFDLGVLLEEAAETDFPAGVDRIAQMVGALSALVEQANG